MQVALRQYRATAYISAPCDMIKAIYLPILYVCILITPNLPLFSVSFGKCGNEFIRELGAANRLRSVYECVWVGGGERGGEPHIKESLHYVSFNPYIFPTRWIAAKLMYSWLLFPLGRGDNWCLFKCPVGSTLGQSFPSPNNTLR